MREQLADDPRYKRLSAALARARPGAGAAAAGGGGGSASGLSRQAERDAAAVAAFEAFVREQEQRQKLVGPDRKGLRGRGG